MEISEQLDLYVRRAEELQNTTIYKSGGLQQTFSISASSEGASFTFQQPEGELFVAFLAIYRHFILRKEPVHLAKVHGVLLDSSTRSPEYQEHLREGWSIYESRRAVGSMHLVMNNEVMTPDEMQDLWINGEYFHNNTQMQKRLAAMDATAKPLARQQFIDCVIADTECIVWLKEMVLQGREDGSLTT
jgi:hypothetical protein